MASYSAAASIRDRHARKPRVNVIGCGVLFARQHGKLLRARGTAGRPFFGRVIALSMMAYRRMVRWNER